MNTKELTIEAATENLTQVIAFVDERLEELGCNMKAQMQIDVALEEIFVNIAEYAYENQTGMPHVVTIRVEDTDDPLSVAVTFTDEGVPFDPLAKKDPDVTLSAEERDIGGLGIYIVKKSMDHVKYDYRDGQNIFTFRKFL